MKKIILSFISVTLLVTSCASQTAGPVETMKDSTAYAIGVFIGENAKMAAAQGKDTTVKIDVIANAIQDIFAKDEAKMQEAYIYLNSCQIASQAFQIDSTFDAAMLIKGVKETIENNAIIKADNANQYIMNYITSKANDEQNAYFAEVDKTEGIQKTENGIRYIIHNQGEGTISENDKVSVNYTLFSYQNDTIDSSVNAGQPLEVQLPSGVVPGFAQAIQLVGVGGKLTVWIPSELGYGENGAGRAIQPNQALKFDIEVVEKLPSDSKASK